MSASVRPAITPDTKASVALPGGNAFHQGCGSNHSPVDCKNATAGASRSRKSK
jgi:hypothetical protein